MLLERSESSRRRKYSSSTKTRNDLELPKINKTNLVIKIKQKQNQSIAEKLAWVIQTTDYTALTDQQIQEEYSKLRKQLQIINLQVQRSIEKLDLKVLKKVKLSEHDAARTLQISDKQVENNNAILQRLRKEQLQLQKRLESVTANSKDDVEQQIVNMKALIQKQKGKIKELKMKNKTVGQSIVNTDDIHDEIKRLETEKQMMERKKIKLQAKTDQVYDQISTSQLRLEEINDKFMIAENFFQQYTDRTQQNEQTKTLEGRYQQVKHFLDVVIKKNQSVTNMKQQKYHLLLKGLQAEMHKLTELEKRTASIQLQIIHCKKQIIQQQQVYRQNEAKSQFQKQLLQQQPVFFTQFESDPVKNDKNGLGDKGETAQEKANVDNKENILIEDKKKMIQSSGEDKQKLKQDRQRIQTNGADQEEEQDIIMDLQLDEKFKYKTQSNRMRGSRYQNQKQTQIGEDLPQIIGDEDEQIIQFKNKISEEKIKRKSKQDHAIKKDIDKIKTQLEKMDFMKNNSESFD